MDKKSIPRAPFIIAAEQVSATRIQTCISSSATDKESKLLDQLLKALRTRHYSRSAETAYVHWVKTMIYIHVLKQSNQFSCWCVTPQFRRCLEY
jgi:hypothetical protein